MEKIDGAEISVVNWDLYNPRTDSKRPIWFRLENTIATGPGFFGLDCEQKWLWVFILSLVSQKNGQSIVWDCAFCYSLTKIRPQKQSQTIGTFEKFGRLRVSREVTSQVSAEFTHYERTNERTNETNIHADFDFESLYQGYPRKEGKSNGLKICKRDVKTPEDYSNLQIAISRYARDVELKKTEPQYIKHFSTFMASWRDWLDPAAGTATVANQEEDRFAFLNQKAGA